MGLKQNKKAKKENAFFSCRLGKVFNIVIVAIYLDSGGVVVIMSDARRKTDYSVGKRKLEYKVKKKTQNGQMIEKDIEENEHDKREKTKTTIFIKKER